MTSPTHKPTLREQLDAVRPDSDDLRDVELQDAARAIEESDQWREIFERQQAFDRELSNAIQEVDVPEGLQSRLMDSLATARQQSEPGVDVVASAASPPISRRSVWQIGALAAGLLVAATLGWLLLPRDGSLITLDEARQLLPSDAEGTVDVSTLPTFDGNFAIDLPAAWKRQTRMASELKGLDWTGDDRHDGAVYEFHAGRRIHGYLLILPSTRISDPPVLTRMSTSGIVYQPVPNTAWVNPDWKQAYICFVDEGDLPTLLHRLYPNAA